MFVYKADMLVMAYIIYSIVMPSNFSSSVYYSLSYAWFEEMMLFGYISAIL